MAVAKQLGSLVETIKSKVRFLKKKSKNKTSSSPVYVKMDKSASVKVEIQSRHARKLINETLKAADSPRKRIIVSERDVPPAHYTVKIEPFSTALSAGYECYKSNLFEAGGHKWKLVVFPNGHEKRDTKDEYVALYLEICNTESLPLGWEVYANFRLFVFDHIRNTFLSMQDSKGLQRFHSLKFQLGFEKFLPLSTLYDASQGYLEDDCRIFGAEVFGIKSNAKGDRLNISTLSQTAYTWTVNNFSLIKEKLIDSPEFTVRNYKWKLSLYPTGIAKDTLSLFLMLAEVPAASEWVLEVEFKLWVRDQINGKHYNEKPALKYTFRKPSSDGGSPQGYGYTQFLPLKDLKCASNGYLVKDTIILEAEIIHLSFTATYL